MERGLLVERASARRIRLASELWIVTNLSLPVRCYACKEHRHFPTNPLLKTTAMKLNHPFLRAALLVAAITNASILILHADHAPQAVLPDAIVDLRTSEGVARMNAQWRYSDTTIREIEHRDVGADLKASGPKNHTFDFSPDARAG